MKFFSRVDEIVGTLASLGVPKSEGDVNRKLVRVLTADYEIEQRTLLYRDEITRAEIESIVRQRHLSLPVPKGKNLGQALFCLLYTSPSPRDKRQSRMPSSA